MRPGLDKKEAIDFGALSSLADASSIVSEGRELDQQRFLQSPMRQTMPVLRSPQTTPIRRDDRPKPRNILEKSSHGIVPSPYSTEKLRASTTKLREKPRPPVGEQSEKRKSCQCKNSKCLKLYCECFANGMYCEDCNCQGCNNTPNFLTKIQQAKESIIERNPLAFQKGKEAKEVQQSRGCNCKKSACLKRYCECYNAGLPCTATCRCVDCGNLDAHSHSTELSDFLNQPSTTSISSEETHLIALKKAKIGPTAGYVSNLTSNTQLTRMIEFFLRAGQTAGLEKEKTLNMSDYTCTSNPDVHLPAIRQPGPDHHHQPGPTLPAIKSVPSQDLQHKTLPSLEPGCSREKSSPSSKAPSSLPSLPSVASSSSSLSSFSSCSASCSTSSTYSTTSSSSSSSTPPSSSSSSSSSCRNRSPPLSGVTAASSAAPLGRSSSPPLSTSCCCQRRASASNSTTAPHSQNSPPSSQNRTRSAEEEEKSRPYESCDSCRYCLCDSSSHENMEPSVKEELTDQNANMIFVEQERVVLEHFNNLLDKIVDQ